VCRVPEPIRRAVVDTVNAFDLAECSVGYLRSCTGIFRVVCTEQKLLVLQRSSPNWTSSFRVLGGRPFRKRRPWLAFARGGMASSS